MILFFVLSIITSSLITQIFFWKLFKPKNTGVVLLFVLLTSNLIYFYLFKILINLDFLILQEYILVIISLISFDLMYIFFFPAVEFPSPSVELIGKINRNKKLNIDEFIIQKENENVIENKLKQLINEKYILRDSENYFISFKGKLLVYFFLFYKKILNQGKGG